VIKREVEKKVRKERGGGGGKEEKEEVATKFGNCILMVNIILIKS